MAYTGPLEDRIAIRELIEAYSDAVFQRDPQAWGATWVDDAVWNVLGTAIEGREAIVETWLGAMDTFDFVAFHTTPGHIAVDGDTATARVYVNEILVPKAGGTRNVQGAYQDTLRKTADGWRFTERNYTILHDETRS